MTPEIKLLYVNLLKHGWKVNHCHGFKNYVDIVIYDPNALDPSNYDNNIEFWKKAVSDARTAGKIRGVFLKGKEK